VNEACLGNALPVEAGTKAVAAPSSAKKHTALALLEEAITVNAQALSLLQVRRRDRRATVGTQAPPKGVHSNGHPLFALALLLRHALLRAPLYVITICAAIQSHKCLVSASYCFNT
jgi:hypothetical protein